MDADRLIRGPILDVTGAIRAQGYDEHGNPIDIDLSGVNAAMTRFELAVTQEGYGRALRLELDKERLQSMALREELRQAQIENIRLSARRWWWQR